LVDTHGFCGKTGAILTVLAFRVVKPIATVRVLLQMDPELARQSGTVANTPNKA